MFKKIFLPVMLILAGCSQKNCKEIYQGRSVDVCMQEGWRIGKEPFTSFTIEKDQLQVKIIGESPSSDPPYIAKEIWKVQGGVIAAFNKPCQSIGDDHAIDVDGTEGWIGTMHLPKTGQRDEFFETFVMVVYMGREYFIDSRCKAADKERNIKLVEEICSAIRFKE